MENQPPSGARPWFRLASLARMETAQAQAQAQAPAPAPAPARPPIQAPVPLARILTSPIQAPPAPQLPQLPPQQQETAPRSSANGTASESRQPPKLPSPPPPPPPPESPRVIKPFSPTPPQSPRTRPYVASPSPYPEPEPKSAMEQPMPKSIKESTNGNVKATNGRSATRKKKEDDGEMKVITMAGENTGAYMELASTRPNQKHHLTGNHHLDGNQEQGNLAEKKKGEKKPMAVVVNSNVQSVNNSILLSGSCTQHSPGVHFGYARHHKPQLSKANNTT